MFGANDWVWRSLVACLNGVQEAGGSNPLTQTIRKTLETQRFQGLFNLRTPCGLAAGSQTAGRTEIKFSGSVSDISAQFWIFDGDNPNYLIFLKIFEYFQKSAWK